MRISDWSSDVCSSDLTGTEDSALVIDVLGNDSSPGGGALTVAAVTQGANGSVTINPDNSLTYTPAPDFFGTDSFAYTVSDDAGSATATVSVTVTPLPDSPVAQDDEAVTTIDTPVSIDVLGNDDDPDGDPLMVDGFTQPTN